MRLTNTSPTLPPLKVGGKGWGILLEIPEYYPDKLEEQTSADDEDEKDCSEKEEVRR